LKERKRKEARKERRKEKRLKRYNVLQDIDHSTNPEIVYRIKK
jgi:hypothetical protein